MFLKEEIAVGGRGCRSWRKGCRVVISKGRGVALQREIFFDREAEIGMARTRREKGEYTGI